MDVKEEDCGGQKRRVWRAEKGRARGQEGGLR